MYTLDEIIHQLPELEQHEAAAKLPMMQEDQLRALKLDILTNGILTPIWLVGNQILDGRARYEVLRCLKANDQLTFTPHILQWEGLEADYNTVVRSLNVHRNHYNKQQLAAYAALHVVPSLKVDALNRMHKKVPVELFPEVKGTANALAALQVGTNEKYVQWACKMKDRNPHYLEFVLEKNMTLQEGIEFIDMKPEKRNFFFEQMKSGMDFRTTRTKYLEAKKINQSVPCSAEQAEGALEDVLSPVEDTSYETQVHDNQEPMEDKAQSGPHIFPLQGAEEEMAKASLEILFPTAISLVVIEEIKEVLHKHGLVESQYTIVRKQMEEEAVHIELAGGEGND